MKAFTKLWLLRCSWFNVSKHLPSSTLHSNSISILSVRILSTFQPASRIQNAITHVPRFGFHSDSSSFSIDSAENPAAEPVSVGTSHPWPEWKILIDRLNSKGYFDQTSPENEEDGDDKVGGAIAKDLNRVRNACLNFARERLDILRLLSKKDIQAVVECGCPNMYWKAVNSGKRLRAFVKLDEGDVCSMCNLRGSCDRAYVIVKEEERAHTVDIMRILLSYAIDPFVLSGEKPHGKEHVEASARKLLSELIEMSDMPPDPALPKPAVKPPSETEQPQKVMAQDNVEMKRGEWICSKCNFMNFSRNIRCLQCKEDGPKRVNFDNVEMKKGDWTCPECQFMNFARNTKCIQCQERRPKGVLNPGEWECPSCDFRNYRRNMVCLKCDCKRPKDETVQYEDQIWRKLKMGNEMSISRDYDGGGGGDGEDDLKSVEEFSDVMSLREGVNRFVVSKRKTPAER